MRNVLAIAAQVISTLRSVLAINVVRSAGPGAMPNVAIMPAFVQRFDGVWVTGYRSADGNGWFSLRLRQFCNAAWHFAVWRLTVDRTFSGDDDVSPSARFTAMCKIKHEFDSRPSLLR